MAYSLVLTEVVLRSLYSLVLVKKDCFFIGVLDFYRFRQYSTSNRIRVSVGKLVWLLSSLQQYNISVKSFCRHIGFLLVCGSIVLVVSLYFRELSFIQLGKFREQSFIQLYLAYRYIGTGSCQFRLYFYRYIGAESY